MKHLDPEKLLEETDYNKEFLYKTLKLFLSNSQSVEVKIHEAFEKRDYKELYKAATELENMVDFLDVQPLTRKLRDLQALALHNNLNDPIALVVKDYVFEFLLELKEEINFILHDQKEF